MLPCSGGPETRHASSGGAQTCACSSPSPIELIDLNLCPLIEQRCGELLAVWSRVPQPLITSSSELHPYPLCALHVSGSLSAAPFRGDQELPVRQRSSCGSSWGSSVVRWDKLRAGWHPPQGSSPPVAPAARAVGLRPSRRLTHCATAPCSLRRRASPCCRLAAGAGTSASCGGVGAGSGADVCAGAREVVRVRAAREVTCGDNPTVAQYSPILGVTLMQACWSANNAIVCQNSFHMIECSRAEARVA